MTFGELCGKSDWQRCAERFCRKALPIQVLLNAFVYGLDERTREDAPMAQRARTQQLASYVLLQVYRVDPGAVHAAIEVFVLQLCGELGLNLHPSIDRQILTICQHAPIPERLAAKLFDRASAIWADLQQPIANRARALETLANLADQYPGLGTEVVQYADLAAEDPSPDIISIRRRVLVRSQRW